MQHQDKLLKGLDPFGLLRLAAAWVGSAVVVVARTIRSEDLPEMTRGCGAAAGTAASSMPWICCWSLRKRALASTLWRWDR